MKFYRADLRGESGTSFGFEWFTSKRDAVSKAKEWLTTPPLNGGLLDDTATAEIEEFEIAPTKAGILSALNRYAAHPDNG